MASTNEQLDGTVERLYKPSEVAKLFNVTPATVREWLNTGILEGIKIGKGHYWRIPKSSVIALATSRHGDTDE